MCFTRSMTNILEDVKRIQVEQGLTDSQIAELLGYKQRENWTRIKGGRAPANEVFQMRAARAFPDDIHVFSGLHTTPAESARDGAKRGVKAVLDKIVLRVKKFA